MSSTATGTAWIDPSTIVAEAATLVVIACKNTSGAAIAQGTPVYQTGTVGATATIEIAPADALISANKLPAIGLLQTALNNNGFGFVVITGELTNFTTSPIDGVVPTTGDKVFVKSGGGLTLTKPTGEGNGIQNMGLVGKVSSGNAGSITVSSIMRTNDVPNLPEGRIWVGDGNTIVSDTVYVDEPNNRVGIGTTNPGTSLEVQSSGANTLPATTGTTLSTGTRFRLASTGSASAVLDFGISTGGKSWLQSTDKTDLSVEYPFLINPNGGDVGIGTSSPGDALVVKGGSPGNIDLVSFQNNAGNETHRFYTDSANDGVIETVTNAGVTANLIQSSGDSYFNGGKVGIGTTSPSNILHTYVNNTDTSIPGILVEQAGTGDSSIGFLLSGVRTWSVGVDNSDSDKFVIGSGEDLGTSSKMVIDTSGNVGIGTTSPQASLQIGNAVGTSSEKLDVRGNSSGNYVASFEQDNATGYGLLIDTDGTLVSEPVLKIKNSSSELFYVGSNGNVGIGIATPTSKLHINQSVTNPDLDLPQSFAVEIDSNHSGSAATTGDREQGGLYIDVDSSTTGGDTGDEHRVYGVYSTVNHSGDADRATGIYTLAEQNTTAGSTAYVLGGEFIGVTDGGSGAAVNTVAGVWGTVSIQDATPVINSYGGYFRNSQAVNRTGATTSTYGLYTEVELNSDSAYTNIYGQRITIDVNTNGFTANNIIGLDFSFTGETDIPAATEVFAIRQPENIRSYFQGDFGIGTASPSSKLQVDGGIQMADDTDAASADKAGTMRYRTGTEYVEVTGTELVTNGDFATNTSWTLGSLWTISGGKANYTNTSTDKIYQAIALTNAVTYRVKFTVSGVSGSSDASIWIGNAGGNTNYLGGTYKYYANGDFEEIFTMPSSQTTFTFFSRTAGSSFSLDNVSVMEVTEEDASYADMCMQTGASTYEWVNIVRNTY